MILLTVLPMKFSKFWAMNQVPAPLCLSHHAVWSKLHKPKIPAQSVPLNKCIIIELHVLLVKLFRSLYPLLNGYRSSHCLALLVLLPAILWVIGTVQRHQAAQKHHLTEKTLK
jgi:hypothetical protein